MEIFRVDTLGGGFSFVSLGFLEKPDGEIIERIENKGRVVFVRPSILCDFDLSPLEEGSIFLPELIAAFSLYLSCARGFPDMDCEFSLCGVRKICVPITKDTKRGAFPIGKFAPRASETLDFSGVSYPYFEIETPKGMLAVLVCKSLDRADAERLASLLSHKRCGAFCAFAAICKGGDVCGDVWRIKSVPLAPNITEEITIAGAAALIYELSVDRPEIIEIKSGSILVRAYVVGGVVYMKAPPKSVYKVIIPN